jgi:hypothetical protein
MSAAESNKPVTARLRWLRPEQGGRTAPPSGPTYSAVARFHETEEQWLKDAWSVVAEFNNPPDSTWSHFVTVCCLSDAAPANLLANGRVFTLYEGQRKVAEGTVRVDLSGK